MKSKWKLTITLGIIALTLGGCTLPKNMTHYFRDSSSPRHIPPPTNMKL